MKMGCYKKDGEYYYSLLEEDDNMEEHQDDDYCVICDVDSFVIVDEDGKPTDDEVKKGVWYKKNEIQFEGVKMREKFFKSEEYTDPVDETKSPGTWRKYDREGKTIGIEKRRPIPIEKRRPIPKEGQPSE